MGEESLPNEAYLGLGSNLGDRADAIRRAASALDEVTGVRVDIESGVAALYETSPVDATDDSLPFLNTVLRVETTLTPHALLIACRRIEGYMGRVRRHRGEPRVIDIDILLFGDRVIDEPDLAIPHPRLQDRRFVLEPLAEIAPDLRHPTLDESIETLADRAREDHPDDRVVVFADRGWLSAPASATR